MTEKQKELLFKDICCRLPYGVKAYVRHYSKLDRKWYEGIYTIESIHPSLNDIFVCSERGSVEVIVGYDDYEIKPYLLPMSSMTEEQWMDTPYANLNKFTFDSFKCGCSTLAFETYEVNLNYIVEFINWCYKNHFDINGLIPMGLASDATNLNIY
jgi:hypothetical protein